MAGLAELTASSTLDGEQGQRGCSVHTGTQQRQPHPLHNPVPPPSQGVVSSLALYVGKTAWMVHPRAAAWASALGGQKD